MANRSTQEILELLGQPKVQQSLKLVRIMWGALVLSGVIVTIALSQLPYNESVAPVYGIMALMSAVASLVVPGMLMKSPAVVARRMDPTELNANPLGPFFLNRMIAFSLSESALVVAMLGFAGLGATVRFEILLAYIVLMVVHFPTHAKVMNGLR